MNRFLYTPLIIPEDDVFFLCCPPIYQRIQQGSWNRIIAVRASCHIQRINLEV